MRVLFGKLEDLKCPALVAALFGKVLIDWMARVLYPRIDRQPKIAGHPCDGSWRRAAELRLYKSEPSLWGIRLTLCYDDPVRSRQYLRRIARPSCFAAFN